MMPSGFVIISVVCFLIFSCSATEPCSIDVQTPAKYMYIPVPVPADVDMNNITEFYFAVKTCNDAHLALSTNGSVSQLDKGVNMYEIVIGGWANTRSVIRRSKQGTNLAVKSSHRPLDCSQFRRFYVRWKDGLIQVGGQTEVPGSPGSYMNQAPFMSYQDPSSPTINHVFVSGWGGRNGSWTLDFPCEGKPTPVPAPTTQLPDTSLVSETCEVEMRTPASYKYLPVAIPSTIDMNNISEIYFAVRTCNDAHLALSTYGSTRYLHRGVNMYEIVIGGWANTRSVIRRSKQGTNLAVKSSHRPLDCSQFRRFYVRWKDGLIEVGGQTEVPGSPGSYMNQAPFMSYQDPSPPTINHVFVSGWGGRRGCWKLDFPCEGKPTPASAPTTQLPDTSLVSETCEVEMRTPASYKYLPVTIPSTVDMNNISEIYFAVRTCNDAHLALSTNGSVSQLDKGVAMYEIVIGGWANTQSVIRRSKQGTNLAVKSSHRPLDCSQFRRFYVRWKDGLIQVGGQTEVPGSPGSYMNQAPFMSYQDPSPPTINHVFVSGWGGRRGCWKLDFPCEGKPTPASAPTTPVPDTSLVSETCEVEMRTPASYKYLPVTIPSTIDMNNISEIYFAVKTCNDAHLALSTNGSVSQLDKGVDMYEIVIGGWANTRSVIRRSKQGTNLAVKSSHRPLDCSQFRRFYVRWKDGLIQVGGQTEVAGSPGSYMNQAPFMSYQDPSPLTINHVFVSGWGGRRGCWKLDFPCDGKPTPVPAPTTQVPDNSLVSETCEVEMKTPASYKYLPVTIPSTIDMNNISEIYFAVKTCNDAHLALSTNGSVSQLDKGDNMYEIVIGGWANTRSVIRRSKQGTNLAVKSSHRPLDCSQFRRFYVRWKDGLIQVGGQTEVAGSPGSYMNQAPFMSYQDPSPPTINHVFVSGWGGRRGCWKLDFPCDGKPTPVPAPTTQVPDNSLVSETCEVEMRTPASYKYLPVTIPSTIDMNNISEIYFAVRTCNDAHLALSTNGSVSQLDKGVNMYEIVIGGWANTRSVIRRSKQGTNLAVKSSHRPLDCSQFRRFYVRWKDGLIQVGGQTEVPGSPGSYMNQAPFMSYQDPSPPPINHVFVSGWSGRQGTWKLEFPCVKETEPEDLYPDICLTLLDTHRHYHYLPVTPPPTSKPLPLLLPFTLNFAVRSCGQVRLLLSDSDNHAVVDDDANLYEIIIGGLDNSTSVLQKKKEGENVTVKLDHQPLHCDQFRHFYLRWGEGRLEVGPRKAVPEQPGTYVEEAPLLTLVKESNFPINHIFASGFHFVTGTWRFEFPCKKTSKLHSENEVPEPDSFHNY